MLTLSTSCDLQVVAHRGASADVPENTMAAFEAALAAGAAGIELDLQLSHDGEPVVFHDATLASVGLGRTRVHELPLASLRDVVVGAGDGGAPLRMPTLDEVLDALLPRTTLLLEIKARRADRGRGDHFRLAEIVVDAVARRDGVDRTVLLSFDAACLRHAKARHDGIRTALNARRPLRLAEEEITACDALSVDVSQLTPRVIERAVATYRPLMTYTVNDERAAARAERAGVSVVMTDRPAWLIGHLDRPPA